MLFAASFPSLPPLKPLLYYSTLYYSTQASILPFLKPLHCSTQISQTSTLLLYSNIYTTYYSTQTSTLLFFIKPIRTHLPVQHLLHLQSPWWFYFGKCTFIVVNPKEEY